MGEQSILDLLLKEKPARILKTLNKTRLGEDKEMYGSKLSNEADTTYSHTVRLLEKMEGHGLIEFEKKGRKKLVTLTEHGEEIASAVTELWNTAESVDGE